MRAKSNRLSIAVSLALLLAAAATTFRISTAPLHATAGANDPAVDPRLKKAYRFTQDGWTYVHLEGSPSEIGFQHGYLLAREIEDAFHAVQVEDTYSTRRDWAFFRHAAHTMLWPHIEAEYQQELQGIADGLKARGSKYDVDDVVAVNAFMELADYYVPWLNKQEKRSAIPNLVAPGNC